jgi:hypothetical protein
MTELAAVESLVLGAGAHNPELGKQIEALGKGVLRSLCELAVQDSEPNTSRINELHFGQKLPAGPEILRTMFEIVVLARLALHIVKASLADAVKLGDQLRVERERHCLEKVSVDHIRALANAAVERRGSERQISS